MGAKISKCCKKSWRMSNPVVVESQPVTVPPWSDAKDKSTQTTRPAAKEAAVVSRWRVLVRTMLLRLHVTTVADAAKAASEAASEAASVASEAAAAASESANKAAQECTPKKKKRNRKKGRRMQTVEEEQGDDWESVNV